MSIFLPYNSTLVIQHFTELFSLDLSSLSGYESVIVTMLANIYFFIFWGVIIYFALKIFNRIWERFF